MNDDDKWDESVPYEERMPTFIKWLVITAIVSVILLTIIICISVVEFH